MHVTSLVLIAWIPVCTMLFAAFRPVRAVTLAYLIGWLVLPMASISIQGFWDIDKILATNAGVALGVLLFCPHQFKGYRFNLADLALLAFATSTCLTSIVNGLGVYDGGSTFTHQLFRYGIPFVFGRAVVKTRSDLYEAARLIVCAAAMYAIAAVWEWRMSPQIHSTLYGFFQHSFGQHVRWGFYRPVVCFSHALGLGMFFAWTSVLGVWLLRAGRLRPVMGIPPGAIVALLLLGLLATMSMAPWVLFLGGFGLLVCWRRTNWRWLLWTPVGFALFWMAGRYTGVTEGRLLLAAASRISEQRAASLQYRVDAEALLIDRARQRPVFGWGGWGRNRARDETGRDLVATDGLWIILLGQYGFSGLFTFFLWLWSPLLMSSRCRKPSDRDPLFAALLIIIGLQGVNFLFNGFSNPVLILISGALVTSLVPLTRERRTVATQAGVRTAPRAALRQGYAR